MFDSRLFLEKDANDVKSVIEEFHEVVNIQDYK